MDCPVRTNDHWTASGTGRYRGLLASLGLPHPSVVACGNPGDAGTAVTGGLYAHSLPMLAAAQGLGIRVAISFHSPAAGPDPYRHRWRDPRRAESTEHPTAARCSGALELGSEDPGMAAGRPLWA